MNEEQEKIKVEETKEEGKKIPKEHKKRGKGIIIIILLIILFRPYGLISLLRGKKKEGEKGR